MLNNIHFPTKEDLVNGINDIMEIIALRVFLVEVGGGNRYRQNKK